MLSNGSNIVSGTIGGPSGNSPPEDFFDALSFGVDLVLALDAGVTRRRRAKRRRM